MSTLSNPYGTAKPCIGCEHWGGSIPNTTHAYCWQDGSMRVHANAEAGCVWWVRCIGADDEEPNKEKR